jgi:DNA-binding CsgD family transcriptional regulator
MKHEILKLLKQKMSVKEIAQILGLSEWTVVAYIGVRKQC